MTWNYRIIRHADGHLALHEVVYDDDGNPETMTDRATDFVSDADEGRDEIIRSLENALDDARKLSVLDVGIFSKDKS